MVNIKISEESYILHHQPINMFIVALVPINNIIYIAYRNMFIVALVSINNIIYIAYKKV